MGVPWDLVPTESKPSVIRLAPEFDEGDWGRPGRTRLGAPNGGPVCVYVAKGSHVCMEYTKMHSKYQ